MSIPVTICDNFLPQDDFERIRNLLYDRDSPFPWIQSHIVFDDAASQIPKHHNVQFCHTLYAHPHPASTHRVTDSIRSEFVDVIDPIIDRINPFILVRAKANYVVRTDHKVIHDYHIDIGPDSLASTLTSAIFYVNTNDGHTMFETGGEIESVANRLITFPANTKHTGTTCTDDRCRVVLNLLYFENFV